MDQLNVFGPVPSRRLGKSIGINNIPPKICSYSCVYCQLGRSLKMRTDRQAYYDPDDLLAAAEDKIKDAASNNEPIDFLTIVPDGEPTLDVNLGKLIDRLKPLNFKVAVITNATMLSRSDVRHDLSKADWVSVKIDTLDENIWRKMDRPHKNIALDSMLHGIREFSEQYRGQLVTETMLVKGLNDHMGNMAQVAQFIGEIKPSIAYLGIPTRPPAEKWVEAPGEQQINSAFQVFGDNTLNVEYLIGYEGNEFAYTGNIEADILSITAVHPMRQDAVEAYLKKARGDFSAIRRMLKEKKIVASKYDGDLFYLRKLDR